MNLEDKYRDDVKLIKEKIHYLNAPQIIINDILNGENYIICDYKINEHDFNLDLSIRKQITEIPNFESDCLYIKSDKFLHLEYYGISIIKNYGNGVIIDVKKTLSNLNNLKKIEEEKKELNQFAKNYLFILNFIKKNYKINNNLNGKKDLFLLNFHTKTNCIFIEKVPENYMYNKIDNSFYLSQDNIQLNQIYPLNLLHFNNPTKKMIDIGILDINKTIEKIKLLNNLESF